MTVLGCGFSGLRHVVVCVDGVCLGPAEGGGPTQTEAVCHASCLAAVHQLP